ncbi:hypothetical protein, partial [Klebsiella sp. CN_Kp116]|uniref:hypothetical protein n=1 Tax=unclassified Klebsiella TaxID=2608929 RepID=UPI0032B5E44E
DWLGDCRRGDAQVRAGDVNRYLSRIMADALSGLQMHRRLRIESPDRRYAPPPGNIPGGAKAQTGGT